MKNQKRIQQVRLAMRVENRRHPATMAVQPKDGWPANTPPGIVEVWRSNKFLAQVYEEGPEVLRVSICRTMLSKYGSWEEDISWEELMQIKREIGLANAYAVEVYPQDTDIVNVANMRHLWVLPRPIIGWRKNRDDEETAYAEELSDSDVERILNGESPESCKGIELGNGDFTGCDQSGGDCPVCG